MAKDTFPDTEPVFTKCGNKVCAICGLFSCNHVPKSPSMKPRDQWERVIELEEELKLRNQEIDDWRLRHQNLSQKYAALRAKLQAVRVQLLFFGSHEDHCIWDQSDYRQCSCGFYDVAEAARMGK